MFIFPEYLFTDVRIETSEYVNYYTANGEVEVNNQSQTTGALIREIGRASCRERVSSAV